MNLGGIFSQAVGLTASFSLWLVLAIFLMTLIAEFGFSIPYLLETVWLIIGYHVSAGMISPASIVLFCVIGLMGREIGAATLYRVSGFGRSPLTKLGQRLFGNSLGGEPNNNRLRNILSPPVKLIATFLLPPAQIKNSNNDHEIALFGKVIRLSPFSVALGRFTWLKLPLTITLGVTKQLLILVVGVGLFSLVWDGIYITLGVMGAGNKISPILMLVCTISSFMCINLLTMGIRHFLSSRRQRAVAA